MYTTCCSLGRKCCKCVFVVGSKKCYCLVFGCFAAATAAGQGLRYICLKWLPSGYPVPHSLHAYDVQLNLHLVSTTKRKQQKYQQKKDESMHCMQTNAKHRVVFHVAFGIYFFFVLNCHKTFQLLFFVKFYSREQQ